MRCQAADCTTTAVSNGTTTTHCVRHGGGRRCQAEGCSRSAQGNGTTTTHCVRHGGGRRCQEADCTRGAEGNGTTTTHCKRHGGGYRCQAEGCSSSASSNCRGSATTHCVQHGGGPRCEHPDHQAWTENNAAGFKHGGVFLCHQHWLGTFTDGRACRAIRKEILFLGNLVANLSTSVGMTVAEFDASYAHDTNLRSCHLLRRPDLLFTLPHLAIMVEFDERGHSGYTESQELSHIEVIRGNLAERGVPYLYVLRVSDRGMFKRQRCGNGEEVWVPTDAFAAGSATIYERLRPWFRAGLAGPTPRSLIEAGRDRGVLVDKLY